MPISMNEPVQDLFEKMATPLVRRALNLAAGALVASGWLDDGTRTGWVDWGVALVFVLLGYGFDKFREYRAAKKKSMAIAIALKEPAPPTHITQEIVANVVKQAAAAIAAGEQPPQAASAEPKPRAGLVR